MRSATKILLIAILILATDVWTFAQDRPDSGSPRATARASAPQTKTSDEDLKELQQALAQAEYWKARAEAAEKSREDWKAESENWRGLFLDERKRSELLVSASGDRKEAVQDLKLSQKILVDQIKEDRDFERGQNDQLRACERSKVGLAFKSAGLGFGLGALANPLQH